MTLPPTDALTGLSAVALRRLIGARQLSPVELLDACIARIERLNPLVNAVTATCFERARDEAIEGALISRNKSSNPAFFKKTAAISAENRQK